MLMMPKRSVAIAALYAAVFMTHPCSADSPLWIGGWGVWGTTDETSGQYIRVPVLQAFVAEGADSTVLPKEYRTLAGRMLHFYDSDGNAGSARVERVDDPDGGG